MLRDSARTILTAAALIVLVLPDHAEADPSSFSMSVHEFCGLSPAEQKTLVVGSFERRLEHAKNVYYESLTRMHNNQYNEGKVGPLLTHGNGGRYRHWRLGGSYRMDIGKGGPDVSKQEQLVVTGLDASAGVVRTTISIQADARRFGRIDVEQDPLTVENRYAYWLDGGHNAMSEYLIRYLLDHRDSFRFESPANGDKVRLLVDWKPVWSDKPLGTRDLILDPQKGFLPISGKAHWEKISPDGRLVWRNEEFAVEASKIVGDVWMPTRLKEFIVASTLGPKVVNVFETEVTHIESGTVKPKDLEVPFLPGMKVVDAIKGVTYTTGGDGKSIGDDQSLVGSKPPTRPALPQPARNFWSFVLINLGAAIVFGAMVLRYLLRKRIPRAV